MLYLFWVTHPPFGFDLYPLLSCWEHCQMFIQPVYVVKEWEVAEDGGPPGGGEALCPFCQLQGQTDTQGVLPGACVEAIPAAAKVDPQRGLAKPGDVGQLSLFSEAA